MTKEVYLTGNLMLAFLNKTKGQELALLAEAIQRAGGRTRIVSLNDMAAPANPVPHAVVNMTGWPCDTHLFYLRGLETAGAKPLNPVYAGKIADDKMLSYLELRDIVPMARTVQFDPRWVLDWANNGPRIEQQIGIPCMVKVTNGARGVGVYKVNSLDDLENLLKLLLVSMTRAENGQSHTNLIIQSFIPETVSKCVRVIVVGNQCLGGMLRYNIDNWRTGQPVYNEVLGANNNERRERYELDQDLEQMSLTVCRTLGLNYASVDFFFGPNGYIVNEIGTSPDTPAFNDCNNLSVYDHVADFVINHM